MADTGENDTSIREFVKSALNQIKSALNKDEEIVDGIINFEISTIVIKGGEGKFDIKVLSYGRDAQENQIQKITIPIRVLNESDIIQRQEKIAKSQAAVKQAEFEGEKADKMKHALGLKPRVVSGR